MNSTNPLSGIRAIEIAEVWAGPFCGCLLGDLGAEVIKLESIQRINRGPIKPDADSGGYPDGIPGTDPWNRNGNFNGVNRNKKGLTLDLKTTQGVDSFKDLVAQSDVVYCNYARSVMENFGLSYQEVRKIKPDIIYMLMPGYGNDGPYADYRSMGMAIDAITGHSYLRGYPDLELSSNSLVHHPDAVAAVNGVMAITSALIYRAKTGKGQFIDMSQAESFMTHLGETYLEYQITGIPRERRGNRHPAFAPQGVYKCLGEDNWIAISVKNNSQWNLFCQLFNDALLKDNRFIDLRARIDNHDVLDKEIEKITQSYDRYDLFHFLQENGITSGVVIDSGEDTYAEPHLNQRDFFQVVEHPSAGIFPLTGPIIKYFGGELVNQPAPQLGEHNNYILQDLLGYQNSKIEDLSINNVIGTRPLFGSDMGGSRRIKP